MVYMDKQPVGRSPISTSFLYHGVREFEVVADGYRTERVKRNLAPRWYEIPPLDFVSETLWPGEIRDERVIDIQMVPYQAPSGQELQTRADVFRLQASQGLATTLPPVSGELLPSEGAGIPVAPDYSPSDLPGANFPTNSLPLESVPLPGSVSGNGFADQPGPTIVLPPAEPMVTPSPAPPAGTWLPQRIPEVGGGYRVPMGPGQ